MRALLSRVVLVASKTCETDSSQGGFLLRCLLFRAAGTLAAFTHSHLSLLLCEVGGDVFEGGGCTGPEREVTLTD